MAFKKNKWLNKYMCVKNGTPVFGTVRESRKESKAALIGHDVTWKEAKKIGWRCIKVDIEFTPVKLKHQ